MTQSMNLGQTVPLRVTSPEVAAILLDMRNVQVLGHFMTPEGISTSALADGLHCSVGRAYRQVKTFERLGLVQVVRRERRMGRPIAFYSCVAQRFFIPRPLYSMEEYLTETFRPFETVLRRDLARAVESAPRAVGGMVAGQFEDGPGISPADADGVPWCDWPDATGGAAVYFGLGSLHLNFEDAKALQLELMTLFGRYSDKAGAARYLYQTVFTPASTDGSDIQQEL